MNVQGQTIGAPPVQWCHIAANWQALADAFGYQKATNALRQQGWATVCVPKRDGTTRECDAPPWVTKQIGWALLEALYLHPDQPHHAAFGFVPGRGNQDAASAVAHFLARMRAPATVLTQDIKNAFPTLSEPQVRAILRDSVGLSGFQLHLATRVSCRNGHLAMGAPQSPHILNLAMRQVDEQMQRLAQQLGGAWIRYADDCTLVIASRRRRTIRKARRMLKACLRANGWQPHPRKHHTTRLGIDSQRTEVCGVSVAAPVKTRYTKEGRTVGKRPSTQSPRRLRHKQRLWEHLAKKPDQPPAAIAAGYKRYTWSLARWKGPRGPTPRTRAAQNLRSQVERRISTRSARLLASERTAPTVVSGTV